MSVVCCSASLFQADLSIGKWPSLVQKVGYIHSYSFISTTVVKTQLCHGATKIKRHGDGTEKKVNVMYYKQSNSRVGTVTQYHIDM